ncbi:hypothetical protein PGT21_005259 [Puccinia graminis f. sp. tritici]|uniref:RRM domain-containing protein n=2 Tax=Puccinia graminis f. sp. tritici TaxID=56615 RepID=E3KL93_PUCGT|nr:uncharacterized protein PGTG_11237 [Puccinia graminis f. sp. tritici CRL 75-36-700-3]EFP85068.2 hypothetical protein PGTG_11237 [Puccinia graminis f. sp. tritici CRL 75-36-700-3]KAA1064496.1 hypothetical protein PGT21_005259 [Puccinia graminis f. sp. tritici]
MLSKDPSNPGNLPPSSSDSRLYVGNLSPAVDEFALVALFSKFGKISKLDFLFHKSGVLRGKPRGYAFIEMNRRDEALKAMVELNNKAVRGKRILVTQANESQYQEHQAANQSKPNHSHQNNSNNHQGRAGQRGRPAGPDPMRPTTLSILKSQQQPKGVNNKIAALEAKLASMQQTGTLSTATPSSSNSLVPSASSLLSSKPSFLPEHPNTLRAAPHTENNTSRRSCNPSATASTRSSKTSTNPHNLGKQPTNLDTIGLTLKEQLKRNRELQSMITKTAKPASTAQRQEHNDIPTHTTSPRPKKSRSHSTSSNNHGELSSSHLSNPNSSVDVSLQLTEKACDTDDKEFKRQKVDHPSALSESVECSKIPEPVA